MTYKDYIKGNPDILRMQNELIQMQIEPLVAAYALFATDLSNTAWAMDFLYERQFDNTSGRPKFQHKFFGCLPDRPEFMQIGA